MALSVTHTFVCALADDPVQAALGEILPQAHWNAVHSLTGVASIAQGGTGLASYTVGDILYASTASALAALNDVATGNALISGGVGVAPAWGKIGLTTHVSGILPVANGGTGLASYTTGDILFASAAGVIASLADVATGNAIISGGIGVAPSYGKIGLATHVSGNLPVTNLNSGTGASASTFWRGDGTWATPAAGGSPGGTPTQLQYNNTTFAGVSGSAVSANGSLTLGGATVTASDPVLNLSQTWNSGAVAFIGFKLSVTNTASAAASHLFQIQVGGVDAFLVDSGGDAWAPVLMAGGSITGAGLFAGGNVAITNSWPLGFSSGLVSVSNHTIDAAMSRIAANVIGFGNGTAQDVTGWIQWGGQTRVTADFSVSNSVTLVNVTGLSVNLQAGRTYSFIGVLMTSVATAGGLKVALSGTATVTDIRADIVVFDGFGPTASNSQTQVAALGTAVTAASTTSTTPSVYIHGTFTVLAAGTMTVQFAQGTSNATASIVKRGSYLIANDMP